MRRIGIARDYVSIVNLTFMQFILLIYLIFFEKQRERECEVNNHVFLYDILYLFRYSAYLNRTSLFKSTFWFTWTLAITAT